MATLDELNARWAETDKPHAALDGDGLYRWSCPDCKEVGATRMPLVGAMSAALAHKNHCPAVS